MMSSILDQKFKSMFVKKIFLNLLKYFLRVLLFSETILNLGKKMMIITWVIFYVIKF